LSPIALTAPLWPQTVRIFQRDEFPTARRLIREE
jgi:hypothetical protein